MLLTLLLCALAAPHFTHAAVAPLLHEDTVPRSLDLTDAELRRVLGDTSVYRSLSRSHCHSSITSAACLSEPDTQEPSEVDKRGLAISLTLCSMQSALQVLPTECQPWFPLASESTPSKVRSRRFWSQPTRLEDHQATCLGPQDWSSYNGYLSDASTYWTNASHAESLLAQLCHALNGRRQAEEARQLYTNATMEKIALLQLLKKREQQQAEHELKFMSTFMDREMDINQSSVALQQTQRGLETQLNVFNQIASQLHDAVHTLELGKASLWKVLEDDIQTRMSAAAFSLDTTIRNLGDLWVQEVSNHLDRVLHKHGQALASQGEESSRIVQAALHHAEARSVAIREYELNEMRTLYETTSGVHHLVESVSLHLRPDRATKQTRPRFDPVALAALLAILWSRPVIFGSAQFHDHNPEQPAATR
nr:uncharacterized protein CI109_003797 [Kwoniella shandongensis]KAA5527825.1 hypothetical protein CI109_003797 [Kwoniella shandongensis]